MADSIEDLKKNIFDLGGKISAPLSLVSFADRPTNSGRPHVEMKGGKYHYVITEKGEELDRRISDQKEDILYWIFKDITSELASEYEQKNRKGSVDFRRLKFSKQLQLMTDIDLAWGERFSKEIEGILKDYPYDDLMDRRTQYCKTLIGEGMSGAAAYLKACEIYPLP